MFKLNKSATYFRCKDVEIPRPVGPADQLALVLRGDAGVFGNPDHRGAQSVGVQVQAVEGLTLLLTETLTCRWKKTASL